MVLHPVEDLDAAVRFYEQGLGLAVRFRDGDRFCALDAGGVTIALAAGSEREATAGAVAVTYKVDDVPAAVAQLVAAGAQLLVPPREGPHEVRAALRDPAGNVFAVYASR
jgi:predicted enzyme related to lactoylglutathione lyase